MNFFQNAINLAKDVQKQAQEFSREMQTVRAARARSSSNDRPLKINPAQLEKLSDERGISVYKEGESKFHVVFNDSQESIMRTPLLAAAKKFQKGLIDHYEIVKLGASRHQLYEVSTLVKLHPEWAELHIACYLNYEDYVITNIKKQDPQVGLNRATPLDGLFPLHIAAERKNVVLVVKLLKLGADISKPDLAGKNAVHYSAHHDDNLIKNLKKYAPDKFERAIKAKDKKGLTPLHYAVQTTHQDTIEFMLMNGAEVDAEVGLVAGLTSVGLNTILTKNPNALMGFTESRTMFHTSVDRKLLKVIHNKNPDLLNQTDEEGRTPLHTAVMRNELDSVVNLVAFGAESTSLDREGNTPLHLAVLRGNELMIKFLIAVDGGVTVKNKDGKMPGDLTNNVAIVQLFEMFKQGLLKARDPPGNELPPLQKYAQGCAVAYQKSDEMKEKKGLRLLSLDGGGIKGIGLIMLLIHIDKSVQNADIMDYIDWIGGTSTGAIIALALAEGISLRDALGLYLRLKDDIFVGARPHDPRPLEKFLQEKFGAKTMEQLATKKKVFVTTTKADFHPPELVLLRNYGPGEFATTVYKPNEITIWKAARCSSAAPTYFPSVDNTFIDGGLMANNPSLDLLNEVYLSNVEKQAKDEEPDNISCLISLGTGRTKSKPMSSIDLELPKNFTWQGLISTATSSANALKNLKNIFVEQLAASDGVVVERARAWSHTLKIPFFRYTPTVSKEVQLNTCDNTEIIEYMWQTKIYVISRSDEELEELITLLRVTPST